MSNVVACLSVLLVCCIPALSATAANVDIEKIDGVVGGSKIPVGNEIVVFLRLNNSLDDTVHQVYNGIRVYSPDGAHWHPHAFVDSSLAITGEWVYDTTYYASWTNDESPYGKDWDEFFSDYGNNTYWLPDLGLVSDTVAFWGFDVPLCICRGLAPQLAIVPWLMNIDSISAASVGKSLCFDSSNFGQIPWIWFNGESHIPSWGGPYCFEIVADCCEGARGNINLDWQDQIDISDLTALVGWMFKSGTAPPCMLEADVDGNGDHDIADVTHLVGYMFKGGPEPVGCP